MCFIKSNQVGMNLVAFLFLLYSALLFLIISLFLSLYSYILPSKINQPTWFELGKLSF